jgi:DsbC/DsbD-like thiol-disulfide interchange protein
MTAPRPALLATLTALAALLGAAPGWSAASDWATNPESRVRLITPYQVAPRDGELRVGIQFALTPRWHVYWKNSGDAGFPPVIVFQEPQGLGEPEVLWPAPHRFELPGDLVAFGYENEVVYPVRAALPQALASRDRVDLAVDVDYLVCEVDCVPYRYTLKASQPLGDRAEPDPATGPLFDRWQQNVPVAVESLPGVATDGVLRAGSGAPTLEIRVRGVSGDPAKADLFLEGQDVFDTDKPRVSAEGDDGLLFRVPLQPLEAGKALPASMPFAWTVTGLTRDGQPLSLEARRDVPLQNGGTPETATPAPVPAPAGFPRALLSAFLGGVLLNLTPAVLALLIPALLALRAASVRPRRDATAAAVGTVVTSWVVAGLALAAQRAGLPAGWGAQLQEPVMAALLVLASALLALNLWGMLEVPLRTSWLVGLWTPFLALSWIASPVAIAADGGPVASLVLFTLLGFTLLGLGLALPYLLVALLPDAVRVLPEPGTWVGMLRGALGFVAAGNALWLLYALGRQVSSTGLAAIELVLLATALLAWLRHQFGGAGRLGLRIVLAVGLAACAVAAPWLADRNRLSPPLRALRTAAGPALEAHIGS